MRQILDFLRRIFYRNYRLRKTAKPFDIYDECVVNYNTSNWLCEDGQLWYGSRWGIFFKSAQNSWWRTSPNNPKNQTDKP